MRKNPPEWEKVLWRHLRNYQVAGVKFRRQQPMGPYIVDFYASVPRLVVEVDGESHNFRCEVDARRQAFLENLGVRVLRFTNEEVRTNLEGVLYVIYEACLPSVDPD